MVMDWLSAVDEAEKKLEKEKAMDTTPELPDCGTDENCESCVL